MKIEQPGSRRISSLLNSRSKFCSMQCATHAKPVPRAQAAGSCRARPAFLMRTLGLEVVYSLMSVEAGLVATSG